MTDEEIAKEIIDVLVEGPGRNMDKAFALHVLGWYITADGDTAVSPTGSLSPNRGKNKDCWLKPYSTSLADVAPAIFDTRRFSSAKLFVSEKGMYFAKVTSVLANLKRWNASRSHDVFLVELSSLAVGLSVDDTAAAALCKAGLACKLDEIEKAASLGTGR